MALIPLSIPVSKMELIPFNDFEVGIDKFDVSAIFDNIGYVGSDPISDSYLKFTEKNGDTILQIDPDGGGSARAVSLAIVKGVSSPELANLDNLIFDGGINEASNITFNNFNENLINFNDFTVDDSDFTFAQI